MFLQKYLKMTNLQKINKNVISIQFVFRGGFKEAEANTVKKKSVQ